MKQVRLLFTVAGGACLACHHIDVFQPSIQNVAGSYTAHVMMKVDPNGSTDWLAGGATLTLMLTADGKTTGHLFVPGGDADSSDLSADMAGYWQLVGRAVQFGQAAATFVREIDFTADVDRLSGDRVFDDGSVLRIILTK